MNHHLQITNPGGQVDRFKLIGFTDDEMLDYLVVPKKQMGYEIDTISPEEFDRLMNWEMTLTIVDEQSNELNKSIIHYPFYFLTEEDVENWEKLVTDTNRVTYPLYQLKDY